MSRRRNSGAPLGTLDRLPSFRRFEESITALTQNSIDRSLNSIERELQKRYGEAKAENAPTEHKVRLKKA
jgi:hypothetical protein